MRTRWAADGPASGCTPPSSNLRFHFDGSRSPALNRDWLAQLADSAESSRGLVIEAEERTPLRALATA
ncbi:hypothetical protein ACRAWC_10465 [Leifsonia sp. L25]|uniref:DUF7882 family protein n=1 Tax=Leifsonia sp. L25 TaxID=3423957 RepID=UPI003D6999A6